MNSSNPRISDQLATSKCNMNNSSILEPNPEHNSGTALSRKHLQPGSRSPLHSQEHEQQQRHHNLQNELDTVATAAQLQQLKQGTPKPLLSDQGQSNTILRQQNLNPNLQQYSFLESSSLSSLSENTILEFKLKLRKKKLGAKKRSWVWRWFDQDPQNPNIAKCTYCDKIIIRFPSDKGSPKKLLEHLKTHKLNMNSINLARPVPIDAGGLTNSSSSESSSQAPNVGVKKDDDNNQNHSSQFAELSLKLANNGNINNKANTNKNLDTNQPFNASRFRMNMLKFLTDNKLSIDVLKSNSFRQLVYDLRPESVNDILELTSMYDAFLECTRYSPGHSGNVETNSQVSGSDT